MPRTGCYSVMCACILGHEDGVDALIHASETRLVIMLFTSDLVPPLYRLPSVLPLGALGRQRVRVSYRLFLVVQDVQTATTYATLSDCSVQVLGASRHVNAMHAGV